MTTATLIDDMMASLLGNLEQLERAHALTSEADRARSGTRKQAELDQLRVEMSAITEEKIPPSLQHRYRDAQPRPFRPRTPATFNRVQVRTIRKLHAAGQSASALGRLYGVSRACIGMVVNHAGAYSRI